MEGAGTRLNVVLLDACRNNPFSAPGLRASGGGLAPMRAPERTLISYATQPGTIAQDGRDGHSPYATALAQTIPRTGLDVLQAFNETGLAVVRATGGQQQPWLSSSPIDASFHFVATPAVSAGATSSPADQAAKDWSEIRDTTDSAVLEAFIRSYGTSFYASLAKARLDNLKAAAAKTEVPVMLGSPPPRATWSALPATESGSPRAVLYNEDPSDPKGVRYVGTAVWRADIVKAAGKPDETVIHADIDVPDRQLKLSMTFARNTDAALPATHTMELTFRQPVDGRGSGIANVPGILMKSNESARGVPLAGLAVKITGGVFLVGLSNVAADRARNLQLLLERSWLDIPVVYNNQRRGILAVEKGASGEAVFRTALAAWGQLPDGPNGRDGAYVQISTQDSEEKARASYEALQAKFPDLLGSRAPVIKRSEIRESTYYRASVGPFDTADEAMQFCSSLKAAGGACFVLKN